MRKGIVLIACFFFLASCEVVVDWHPEGNVEDRLVVEAILTDELKHQEIYLSGLLDSVHLEGTGKSGAFIKVQHQTIEHLFWESAEVKGLYVSNNEFQIEPSQEYSLSINIDNQEYNAVASGVHAFPMRSFGFVPYQETDSVYIAGLGAEYSEVEEAMYEFQVDWSEVIPGEKTKATLYHFVFKSINIGQLFGPEKARFIFPKGSTVIIKKYNLDPEYAEYIRSMVVETQWKGGFFEESAGDLPTNLDNGALGYFAICTVQSDTIVVE